MKQNRVEIYDVKAMRALAARVFGSRVVSVHAETYVSHGLAEVVKLIQYEGWDCWLRAHYSEEPVIEASNVSEADALAFLWSGSVLKCEVVQ
jgi:hypothetical protein